MKTTVLIYTNGITDFSVENHSSENVLKINGITLKKEVSSITARSLHSNGSIVYVFGKGDLTQLIDEKLTKRTKLNNLLIY